MSVTLKVRIGETWYTVEVEDVDATPVRALVDGEPVEVDLRLLAAPDATEVTEAHETGAPTPRSVPTPINRESSTGPDAAAPPSPGAAPAPVRAFRSPMAGVIVSVAVKQGDQVVTGDEVCVLEAMKMHQSLSADWSGIVGAVHVAPGQHVKADELLVELQ